MFKKNECSHPDEKENLDLKFDEIEERDEFFSTEKQPEEYKTVDTLLLFVGYPRSRHTLLSALLDGHPHIVLANEYSVFSRISKGQTFTDRNKMVDELVTSSKQFLERGGKGKVMQGSLGNTTNFGFYMEGYWQGTYDRYIKVIGDKTAWYTALVFRDLSKDSVKRLIDNIENDYKVKVKFIHLIRNPFDIVSTITLRRTRQQEGGARFSDHSEKLDDPKLLQQSISRLSRWVEGSAIAREILDRDTILDVNGLELVQKPVETMATICQFIGISCSEDFLQACAKVVDPKPSITRHYVVWPQELLDQVYSMINTYPFLSHYTFED
ncbi:hypothetical protein ACROYT_G006893 [Oculina patagonica]